MHAELPHTIDQRGPRWLRWLIQRPYLAAVLLLALFILPGLGDSGLLDPWEMDRAATARRIADSPRVLVIDGDGDLLTTLRAELGDSHSLHTVRRGDSDNARLALRGAAAELHDQIAHAVVIDLAEVLGDEQERHLDDVVAALDSLDAQNRGIAIILVADPDQRTRWRNAIAIANAQRHRKSMQGGWWRHGTVSKEDTAALGGLFRDSFSWVERGELGRQVRRLCASPWLRAQHKVDNFAVQAPWLDSVLIGVSIRLFGPSETSVRLPGALIVLLIGSLLAFAGQRLLGTTTAWLAVVVFATLPMTLGPARLVTLEMSAPLGVTLVGLGLAMGAAQRARWWGLWLCAGLVVLFLGRGLAGLTMATIMTCGYLLATRDFRGGPILAAGASVLALAVASMVVLGDDQSALLRSFRFTQMPFQGGLPDGSRDFSAIVGQAGFALYPWGPLFLLGMGRLLFGDHKGGDETTIAQERGQIALAIAFAGPLLAYAALLPHFHHVVLPLAAMVALITAVFLKDVLDGRIHGGVIALLVIVPTLLLHREIGKDASTMVRWLAVDPPFGKAAPAYTWPTELGLARSWRAVALLLVFACSLGLARPMVSIRRILGRLQKPMTAIWAASLLAVAWGLDVLFSLGTRLDVLLKSLANQTGYQYDRIWVTLQSVRPEVIAGATLFAITLIGAASIAAGRSRQWRQPKAVRWLVTLCNLLGNRWVALTVIATASIGTLLSGVMVLSQVQQMAWSDALAHGLYSSASLVPLGLALGAALLMALVRWPGRRWSLLADDRPSAWSRLLSAICSHPVLAIGGLLLVAIAGVGIGASQAAGTWSYGYMAACWGLSFAIAASHVAHAGTDLSRWAATLLGTAVVVWGTIFGVLVTRLFQDGDQPGDYLLRLLLTAPDSALLLLLIAAITCNRMARSQSWLDLLRRSILWSSGLLERPRVIVSLLVVAALALSANYGHGLLPDLSVHFSQKHILNRIASVGGEVDAEAMPRTFKYAAGSGHNHVQNNFYTRQMPTISDRNALLDLLANRDTATRVSDFGPLRRSVTLALAGWSADNDQDGDRVRDEEAWFGVAQLAEGVSVVAAEQPGQPLAWPSDRWRGAKVYSRGRGIEVIGNTENSLTLSRPPVLVAEDPRRGRFSIDRLAREGAAHDHSAMTPVQRFVVLPKVLLSELNHGFRVTNDGRHIPLLDARSSRLVLATNELPAGESDENWLAKSVLTRAEFDSIAGIQPIEVNFDNQLVLIGYRLEGHSLRRTEQYKLHLYFEVKARIQASYMLFMHPHPLHRDLWPHNWYEAGDKDAKRCTGCFQTNHWVKADIIHFPIVQQIPLGTQSGPHEIILGWYNPLNDKRLTVMSATGAGVVQHSDNRVTITRLQVR
jgi:hypothetical protein